MSIIDELVLFSAGSGNDEHYKNLWVKGASLFIPQINQLININKDYNFIINDIYQYLQYEDYERLGNILEKNGSDKSTNHNYHIFYSYAFNKLNNVNENKIINILEIGLGTNNPTLVSTMGSRGKPGASLYAFREYLPNLNIYGADIDKNILFESERIKTCYVDQLDIKSFDNISNSFKNIKYDLIIDDGLHSIGANFNTLLFALKNINKGGWIIIEDIHIIENWKSIDFILSSNPDYKTYAISALKGYLYAINKL